MFASLHASGFNSVIALDHLTDIPTFYNTTEKREQIK